MSNENKVTYPPHANYEPFPELKGEENTKGDPVNLPDHYARYKIEPIRFLVENFGPSILVGKVVKYSMRYDAKNGLQDLKKARRCLDMLIAFVEGNPDWWKRSGPKAQEAVVDNIVDRVVREEEPKERLESVFGFVDFAGRQYDPMDGEAYA